MKKLISNIIIGTTIFFTQPNINREPAQDVEITIVHYDADSEQIMDDKYYNPDKKVNLQDGIEYEIEIKTLRKISIESIIKDLQVLTGGRINE